MFGRVFPFDEMPVSHTKNFVYITAAFNRNNKFKLHRLTFPPTKYGIGEYSAAR